jgi:hypothetical protein
MAAKRAAMSVLAFSALAGAMVVAPATAQAVDIPAAVADSASEQLDVGVPGEGDANVDIPAVAPDGNLVWPTPTAPMTQPSSSATAQSWIAVTATADGARIRARPVNGPVVGTIAYGAGFWVSCTRGASDGHAWGWSYRSGTYGWVRSDLWEVEQHTGPGGAGTPQVPRCP